MSWGEVFKINSNMKKPLNVQMRDYNLMPMWIFKSSTEWTPPKSGLYRVICVGAGGNGDYSHRYNGGAGGIVVGIHQLNADTTYNLTVSRASSFSTLQTATAGSHANSSGHGAGGSGSGGDAVYNGSEGVGGVNVVKEGGSVSLFTLGSRAPSENYHAGGYGAGGGYIVSNYISYGGVGFLSEGKKIVEDTSAYNVSGSGGDACIIVEFISEE